MLANLVALSALFILFCLFCLYVPQPLFVSVVQSAPGIVPVQEVLEDLLAALAGQGCLPQGFEAAQVFGFALEGDLGAPAAGAFVLVYAADTAAVVLGDGLFLDGVANGLQAGALHDGPRLVWLVLAAAADGVAALEVGLAHSDFVSAVTSAFPEVLAAALAVIGDHLQHAEALADPVLPGRPAQATAALAIAGLKLAGRRGDGIAAVTDAVPHDLAGPAALRQYLADRQLPEPLPGQVLAVGMHLQVLL